MDKMQEIKDRPEQRIIQTEGLISLADRLRKEGKRIVTTNGSFDLLHAGHLQLLKEAKEQGDVLIVGLNSDASVKQYKSKDRPIIPQEYRAEMLAAIRYVDYVVIMDEPEIAVPLVTMVKPDVHVNGSEYGENCIEAGAVKKNGGRLHIVKLKEGLSTTEIVGKICRIYGQGKQGEYK